MNEWTVKQWIEHGRAWVAVGWSVKRGQVGFVDEQTVLVTWCTSGAIVWESGYADGTTKASDFVPDMSNWGTRGHALGQVRRAWGAAYIAVDECLVDPNTGADIVEVRICTDDGMETFKGASIHEALLAARKAAP